jgi:HPt (histidine-containing phosphotransfer) domain-containing protein
LTFDKQRLEDVCVGSNDLKQRILLEYLRISPSQVASLIALINSGDAKQVELVAHALKGSSRSIGAIALGELCEAVELNLEKAIDPRSAVAIAQEFERLEAALRAELESKD